MDLLIQKPFRHLNADVAQAGRYMSLMFMGKVWPGVISVEMVFKTLDGIREVSVDNREA